MNFFRYKKYYMIFLKKFSFNSSEKSKLKLLICEGCKLKQLESKLLCNLCSVIYTPLEILNKKNYFDIFNLNQNFSIDKIFLESKYKEIQKFIHPDKFAMGNDSIIKDAHQASSLVGIAYHTLLDDFSRGNYLLYLKGCKNISEGNQSITDKNFLEEFMDVRERIEDAKSIDEILEIKIEINEKINNLVDDLNKKFQKEDYSEALEILKKIKFNLSILENIKNKI